MEAKIERTKKGKLLKLVPHLPTERNSTVEVSLIESITGEPVDKMDVLIRKWYEHTHGLVIERRNGCYRVLTAEEQADLNRRGVRLAARTAARGHKRAAQVNPLELPEKARAQMEHAQDVLQRVIASLAGACKEITEYGKLAGKKPRAGLTD